MLHETVHVLLTAKMFVTCKNSRCNIIFLINLVVMSFMQDVRFTKSSLGGASNSKASRLNHLNAHFTDP